MGGEYIKNEDEAPDEPAAAKKDGASEESSIFSSISNIFQKKDGEEKQEGGSFWDSIGSVFKKEPTAEENPKSTPKEDDSEQEKTEKKSDKKGRSL